MTARYIEHLTLATGHQRRSYRDEVSPEAIALLRPLLERVAAGEQVEVPGFPSYTIAGALGRDRALLVTLRGPPVEGMPCPLLTFGIAPSSRASAALWRDWMGCERDDRTPRPPWCCVELLPSIVVCPDALEWAGDFERCCAWAWIAG